MRWKFVVGAVWSSLAMIAALVGWSVAGPAAAAPLVEADVSQSAAGDIIYLSSTTGGSVGGVTFADEDVVAYDPVGDSWSLIFDGSDVGLASADIDGFTIVSLDPFAIEMSFTGGRSLPGVGVVDDSDVVRFSGTAGPNTSGGFLLVVDGSDIGFSTNNEDLDAVGRAGSDFVLSSLGPFNVPGLTGDDEDLMAFSATSTGSTTAGIVALFRDGTADGLGPSDVTGVSVDLDAGRTYGAALNAYSVGGVSGDKNDVFMFPTATMAAAVVFDGDLHGFGAEQIDGIHVGNGSAEVSEGSADLFVSIDDQTLSVEVGDVIEYDITIGNNGPDDATSVVLDGTPSTGLTLTGVSGCVQTQTTLPCLVGDIEAGQSTTVTISALVGSDAPGSVDLGVAVGSAADDPVPANNTAATSTPVVTGPSAVDDGPAADSAPGDLFHIAEGGSLTVVDGSAQDLLANDGLGDPPGEIESFGGGDAGGSVTDNLDGTNVTVGGDGSLQIDASGAFSFTAPTGFVGPFTVDYRLANAVGDSDATLTIYVGPRPSATVYLSSNTSGVAGGVAFGDEDIVFHDGATNTWGMLFDGSDMGLTTADIDGFHIVSFDPLTIDMSLTAPRSIPGVGVVDDSDVMTFTGTGGENTSGAFTLLIDGSDLGFSSGGEDLDAVAMSGSDYLLSTLGSFNIPGGLVGADEDLLSFAPTATGSTTTGALSLLFDGSDVGLAARDLTGVWADSASGDIYGAALGNYTVAGTSGDSDDVFAFTGTTGSTTAGTARIIFDGDAVGFGGEQIDGLHVVID